MKNKLTGDTVFETLSPHTVTIKTHYENKNTTDVQVTNTIVGTVHVEGGQTGSNVGNTTNVLAAGYTFVASKVSVGGGITSSLQITNTGGVLDGALIYVPNINGSGTFLGYTI